MKVPLSWMREFVAVPDDPKVVAAKLASCGFAVDSIEGDVIDFDVTANRPDCLSVYGLAREAAVAFGLPLSPFPRATGIPAGQTPVKVSIGDAGCGRYALAVIADVKVGPSPDWLASRLHGAGVRPINNVVDITNYVMLELGQPMHAFDAAKLEGPEIRVRRARPGEVLTTLDGQERKLDESMLVIADHERAVALAGVMGGASSEVSAGTSRIALESAWFLPASVRATGRKVGLKTEASARFERGADIAASFLAIERAIQLFARVGAGSKPSAIADLLPRRPAPRTVALRRERLKRVLGLAVPDADVSRVLTGLGFIVTPTSEGWSAEVPSFRVDVTREVDLVEEVGRHIGLDRVPATFPALTSVPKASAPAVGRARHLRRVLTGVGLQEAVTFTFIDDKAAAPFAEAADLVQIANPLSEKFAVLRPSLVPGLLESLTYNRNRQATDIRLFELGSAFSKSVGERPFVGWVLTGLRGAHWTGSAGSIDFSDARGVAELIGECLGVPLEFDVAAGTPWLVAGQGATVRVGGQPVGWVGRVKGTDPTSDPVFGGELNLQLIERAVLTVPPTVTALPRYPTIVRDLSIVVDERLPAAKVRGTIRTNAPATLVRVREFDRYQGKGVPDGHVSLSIRLTFQHQERTLTDADVQPAVDGIVRALERDHQAVLRGR